MGGPADPPAETTLTAHAPVHRMVGPCATSDRSHAIFYFKTKMLHGYLPLAMALPERVTREMG